MPQKTSSSRRMPAQDDAALADPDERQLLTTNLQLASWCAGTRKMPRRDAALAKDMTIANPCCSL